MVQSLFGGCTDYTEQSLKDIREDILHWKNVSIEIKKEFQETIKTLTECGYWEKTVPYDYRVFCNEMMVICDTFLHDFSIVLDAIDQDKITNREIEIMKNIYQISHEREKEWPRVYRTDDSRWHQYGDENFTKAEELYAHGRDYFVMLFDVGNMTFRLKQYMKKEIAVDNSIHVDNSIIVGNDNNIKDSTFHTGSKNLKNNIIEWLLEHLWLPILVTVIGGLLLWLITK